ncbi:electron transport protein SCO1/SenC [gamma proteobacterium HTCC5015]|nr:electron transport protein SCO1/SenC [gamma proteobacterium HTCC5015]
MTQNNASNTSFGRRLITAILVAAVALGGGYALREYSERQAPLELENATLYPEDFRPFPTIRLTADDGSAFTNAHLKGRWTLLFFGFTHCPDVCPNTLAVMADAYQQLGERQQDVQVVFISVDPERDRLDKLGSYVQYFDPDFIGVTSSEDKLQQLADGMDIFYKKQEADEHGNYQVDHSGAVFVLNPDGRRHALMSAPHLPQAMASDLLTMMEAY